MADTTELPKTPQPTGNSWLEEVKKDAEYLYKKRMAEQKADQEYEASKLANKKK